MEETASSTLAVNEKYTRDGMREFLRMYRSLMPYMRTYKDGIMACWEDEKHVFTLQRMPFSAIDIEHQTTCGHLYCSFKHGVMEPCSWRVSIEHDSNFIDGGAWSTNIPLAPLHRFESSWTRWPSGKAKKGKGKKVEHWLCLTCLESLWFHTLFQAIAKDYANSTSLPRMESTGFAQNTTNKAYLPTISDLSILRPETRTGGPKNIMYNLSSPHVYALAKWTAVIRWNDWYDVIFKEEAAQYFYGEPETMYEDLTTLNLRGIDELTGLPVEIPATYIKGSAAHPIKFLSDVLEWVDAEVEKVRQKVADKARNTIHASVTPAATQAGGDTEDGRDTSTINASTPATSNDANAENQPLPLPLSPAAVSAHNESNVDPEASEVPDNAPSLIIVHDDDDMVLKPSSPLSSLGDEEDFMQIDIDRSVRAEETVARNTRDDDADDEKMEVDEDYGNDYAWHKDEVNEPPSIVDRVKTRARIPTRRPL